MGSPETEWEMGVEREGEEGDRHDDAGPLGAHLGRSASGRLPPAYGQLLR